MASTALAESYSANFAGSPLTLGSSLLSSASIDSSSPTSLGSSNLGGGMVTDLNFAPAKPRVSIESMPGGSAGENLLADGIFSGGSLGAFSSDTVTADATTRRARDAHASFQISPSLSALLVGALVLIGVLAFQRSARHHLRHWLHPSQADNRVAMAGGAIGSDLDWISRRR